MKPKTIIRIVLPAVIAIAVGGGAVKEFGPAGVVAGNGGSESTASVTRPDGLTVMNCHGEKRCRTCIGIGELARQTLDEEFAAEEKAGKVRWEQINFDQPANARFVKDYQLVSSTVLITLWKDGRQVEWNRLDAA